MSDVDRLTIVVACLGLLIHHRIPENPAFYKWGLGHLTFDLIFSGILLGGVVFPVFSILGGVFK